MNAILRAVAALPLLSLLGLAETWTGAVVDVMCKGKDVANHTRQCALSCAKSGFGIVLSDGKFVKFDEAGNAMTLTKLKTWDKDKGLKVKVTGALDGDVINVEKIELD